MRYDIHDWVANECHLWRRNVALGFKLTDDERQLRDLAFQLVQPSYDRHQWYSGAGEYGLIGRDERGKFDVTAYATRLFGTRYRSPSARYATIPHGFPNSSKPPRG